MITYFPHDPLNALHCCRLCNHTIYDIVKRQCKCTKLGHWIEHENEYRPNDCHDFDTAFHNDFKRRLR